MKQTLYDSGTYSIFSTPTLIRSDSDALARDLAEELSCYPKSDQSPVCEIRLLSSLPAPTDSIRNPKLHNSYADGFHMQGRMSQMHWHWEEGRTLIDISINEYGSILRSIYRALHRQNTTRTEMAGQILHEGVLIPRLLTSDQHALLHASAIARPDSDQLIGIGGTGGSGKTSLMLQACLKEGWSFAADDISVLSENGELHPNYSFPKIYGYNLDAFPELSDQLFKQKPPMDKLHWKIHHLRGADKVRRRVDPRIIFPVSPSNQPSKLADYVILSRSDTKDVKIESISTERAATASAHVLATEYNEFFNHLHWQRFNHLLSGRETAEPTAEFSIDRLSQRIEKALSQTRCWVLNVPTSISHRDFLDQAWPIIQEL